MKATLEFNLPEESEQHQQAVDGWKYQMIIDEIFNYLRRQEKLGKVTIDIEEMRETVVEIREQQGIYT